jgi:hypothetical protein
MLQTSPEQYNSGVYQTPCRQTFPQRWVLETQQILSYEASGICGRGTNVDGDRHAYKLVWTVVKSTNSSLWHHSRAFLITEGKV